jgi:hypothetical protein
MHFFSRKSVLLLTWSPEWDERKDEQDPVVTKALRDDRKATKNGSKSKKEDEDDDDDDADGKK